MTAATAPGLLSEQAEGERFDGIILPRNAGLQLKELQRKYRGLFSWYLEQKIT